MISSDDSPSSPALGAHRRTSLRKKSPSYKQLALETNLKSKIRSETISYPEKQMTFSEITINGHHLKKMIQPDNILQAGTTCQTKSKPQTELKHSSTSPVRRKRCILPKTTSSQQCSSKDLKEPVKAQKRRGRKKKESTLSSLSPFSNVLATRTDSLVKEQGTKTIQQDIKILKVSSEGAKKQLPSDNLNKSQSRKTSKKLLAQTVSDSPSHPHSNSLHSNDSSLLSTPRRGRTKKQLSQLQRPCLRSTPHRSTSIDNLLTTPLSPVERKKFQDASPISELKVSEATPLEKTPESGISAPCRRRGWSRKTQTTMKTQGQKRGTKTQTCCSVESPLAKRRCLPKAVGDDHENSTTTQSHQRCRPRFALPTEAKSPKEDRINPDETTLSSDLSIELSLLEDHLTSLPIQEEEQEEEDEEELPSFLIQMDKRPPSITEGICVWCKFRNYPFWPAMVKSVNRKLKKASIIFIDDQLLDKKRIRKGFCVALKTLKPFDCEEADQLMEKAKEKYEAAITWCQELITDYRIRIGCGSFTGSFIEYFTDDISCPVRRMYPQGTSSFTFPSKLILEEDYVALDDHEEEEDESSEQQEEQSAKKLLPDRSKAARNRANEKLVHFITKQRKVEKRLLAVISGQQQSKWLRSFLRASRTVVDTYLEDEEQLDQVYLYLKEVYDHAPCTASCLADVDRIRFVLDVLLPEAIIFAIAGVDKVSLEKAEDKYRKGPCLSKREREEFDLMIEQQMKMKSIQKVRPLRSSHD